MGFVVIPEPLRTLRPETKKARRKLARPGADHPRIWTRLAVNWWCQWTGVGSGKAQVPSRISASGSVEADEVVPAVHDRQDVGLPVVAAEADGNRPIGVAVGGEVVDGVGVAVVGLEEPGGVVQRDGPEAVHRDVAHGELVFADRQARVDVDVGGLGVGQAAPSAAVPIRCRTGSTWPATPKAFVYPSMPLDSSSRALRVASKLALS